MNSIDSFEVKLSNSFHSYWNWKQKRRENVKNMNQLFIIACRWEFQLFNQRRSFTVLPASSQIPCQPGLQSGKISELIDFKSNWNGLKSCDVYSWKTTSGWSIWIRIWWPICQRTSWGFTSTRSCKLWPQVEINSAVRFSYSEQVRHSLVIVSYVTFVN